MNNDSGHILIVERGVDSFKQIELTDKTITLGRGRGADIIIDNSYVSSIHAEISVFEGQFNWESLQDALNLSSLFSSQKKIVIKNPWFFTKTLSDRDYTLLEEALKSMSHSDYPVVIVHYGAIDQRKKPFKAVKAVSTHSQHDPFKDWELQKVQSWLSQRAQQHDLSIEPDALWALTEHCGTHLRQLAGELDKLSVYIGQKRSIQLSDVKAICLGPQGRIFEFTEYI